MDNSSMDRPGSPVVQSAGFDPSALLLLAPLIAFIILLWWGLKKRNRRDRVIELSSYLIGIELLLFLFLPVSQSSIFWAAPVVIMAGALITFMRYWAVKDSKHRRRVLLLVSSGHVKSDEVLDYGVGAELKRQASPAKEKTKVPPVLGMLSSKLSAAGSKIKSINPGKLRPSRRKSSLSGGVREEKLMLKEEPTEHTEEPKAWPSQATTSKKPWWAKPLDEGGLIQARPSSEQVARPAERAWGPQPTKAKESEKPKQSPPKTLQSRQRLEVKRQAQKRADRQDVELGNKPPKSPKWLIKLQAEEREKAKALAVTEPMSKGKKYRDAKETDESEPLVPETPTAHAPEHEPDHEKINSMIDEVITKRKKPEEDIKEV